MRSAPKLLVSLTAVAIAWTLPARADAAAEISVSGTVSNGTQGASLPGPLTIVASQITADNREADRRTAEMRPDGTFQIPGFDSNKGTRFVAGTDYLGVTYSVLAEASGSQAVGELKIYETTEDDSALTITSDVLTVVKGDDDDLEIIHIQRFQNSGDRTFVGREEDGARRILRLPVPTGAFDLAPAGGMTPDRVAAIPGGFASGDPLPPGEVSPNWIYKIKAPRVWALSRPVFYPTAQADILIEEGLTFEGSGFTLQDSPVLRSRKYRRYRRIELTPGDIVSASVGRASSMPGPGLSWGLGGALAVLIAVVFLGMRARGRRGEPTRAELIEQIAELDEALAAGTIEAEEHRSKRQLLKNRLTARENSPS